MIRRSFRIGLWAGVIAALAYMASRSRRRSHQDPYQATDSWPAIQPAARPDVAAPVAPTAPTAPAESDEAPEPAVAAKPKAPAKAKAKAKPKAPARAWVEPSGNACPETHQVKAKESSKIFHVPGGLSYDRTQPDRCYADESAAEADGYRKSKR